MSSFKADDRSENKSDAPSIVSEVFSYVVVKVPNAVNLTKHDRHQTRIRFQTVLEDSYVIGEVELLFVIDPIFSSSPIEEGTNDEEMCKLLDTVDSLVSLSDTNSVACFRCNSSKYRTLEGAICHAMFGGVVVGKTYQLITNQKNNVVVKYVEFHVED
ncbi:hypothetical protein YASMINEVIRUS_487 [Yasminevirus sp. GU-2018]|uniref:Uncharacterized protein n=1 Tax=Yasminevirus sp. GU-2018 TaxID=2420051 RepID=A0A5K0U970_9VIRU|nr:hypothetical protein YASMINEVIRUS_487 [Yasminevirus sp. GU-2018]